jgi:DNA-binding transcriptional LysR family regulator
VLDAALEGVGLAQVPEPLAAQALAAGKLVTVLAPFAPMSPGMFLYYPGKRQVLPKLRAFIDHVKKRSGGDYIARTDDERSKTRRRA